MIKKTVGYEGRLVFDKTKPDGQPKRKLEVSRAKREFGFRSETGFNKGLKEMIEWYIKEAKI